VGVLTGIQDRIDWRSVGMSALSGGVNSGLTSVLGPAGSGFGAGAVRALQASAVTQGLGVATGLQAKFDWVGLATAGLQGGVGSVVANSSWLNTSIPATDNPLSPASLVNALTPGLAGGITAAAVRSAATGTDFGDNLRSVLPDVIGSTIGNALAAKVMNGADLQPVQQAQGQDPNSPQTVQSLVDIAASATGGRPGEFAAPRIAYSEDGIFTEDGRQANGAYVPGRNRSDPGTILLDANLARQAQYDEVAQAKLGAVIAEESFGSVFKRRGIDAVSVNGVRVDPGGYLAQQYLSGIAASGQGAFRFTLDGQTYAPSSGALSSIMGTTFSQARLEANVTDRGGETYQVAGGWGMIPIGKWVEKANQQAAKEDVGRFEEVPIRDRQGRVIGSARVATGRVDSPILEPVDLVPGGLLAKARSKFAERLVLREAVAVTEEEAAKVGARAVESTAFGPPRLGLRTPQGMGPRTFDVVSGKVQTAVGDLGLGDDVFVMGSRSGGTARVGADFDFGVRLSPSKFDELIAQSFRNSKPGSALSRTRDITIRDGRIQTGEAGLRGVRGLIARTLGVSQNKVQISVIRSGGVFDNGPQTPLAFVF